MDAIAKARLNLRHQKLTQIISDIEKYLEAGQILEEDLFTSRLRLKQYTESFDTELKSCSNYLEAEEFTDLMNKQLEAEELELKLGSLEELNKRTLKPSSSAKLPKLELSKFNGDLNLWSDFWDRFEANIDSKNLKDVEKLAYLLSSLEGHMSRECRKKISCYTCKGGHLKMFSQAYRQQWQ